MQLKQLFLKWDELLWSQGSSQAQVRCWEGECKASLQQEFIHDLVHLIQAPHLPVPRNQWTWIYFSDLILSWLSCLNCLLEAGLDLLGAMINPTPLIEELNHLWLYSVLDHSWDSPTQALSHLRLTNCEEDDKEWSGQHELSWCIYTSVVLRSRGTRCESVASVAAMFMMLEVLGRLSLRMNDQLNEKFGEDVAYMYGFPFLFFKQYLHSYRDLYLVLGLALGECRFYWKHLLCEDIQI